MEKENKGKKGPAYLLSFRSQHREGVVGCSVGVVSRATLHLGKPTYIQTLSIRLV